MSLLHPSTSAPQFNKFTSIDVADDDQKPQPRRTRRIKRAIAPKWLFRSKSKIDVLSDTPISAKLSASLEAMNEATKKQEAKGETSSASGKRNLLGDHFSDDAGESTRSSITSPAVDAAAVASERLVPAPPRRSVKLAGWLQKWTNYISGYRRRWFVLDDEGCLAYYR